MSPRRRPVRHFSRPPLTVVCAALRAAAKLEKKRKEMMVRLSRRSACSNTPPDLLARSR